MDEILRRAWSKIFQKHSAEHPKPRVGPFMDAYGHLLTRYEMDLKPLTLKQIKKTLSRLKETGAAGLDGWNPSDLKALPDSLLRYLLLFYDIVEETNEWPRALTWASVTLIPKGEGGAPLDQRPLSVMPLVYRVWAAARVRDCMDWQEKRIGDGQHGCRPSHGTSNAILRIGLETESALLNNEELAVAALDFSKAFDNVPIAITLAVLKRLGLHERIFNPLLDMYAKLQRRFKIRGALRLLLRTELCRAARFQPSC